MPSSLKCALPTVSHKRSVTSPPIINGESDSERKREKELSLQPPSRLKKTLILTIAILDK
jgi:hypothetical protein